VTGGGILVEAIEMRFVPEARPLQFRRPPRPACVQLGDYFKPHRCGLVALGLDQDLENFAFAVNSAPHVHLPSGD
jgi:hypothetical protein